MNQGKRVNADRAHSSGRIGRSNAAGRARMRPWKKAALAVSVGLIAAGLAGKVLLGDVRSGGGGLLPATRATGSGEAGVRSFVPADGTDDSASALPGGRNVPAESPDSGESGEPGLPAPAWAPAAFTVGFGFVAGFAIAYALRVVFKLAVVFLGLWLLSLVALEQAGILTVDVAALAGRYEGVMGFLAGQFESLRSFLTGAIPGSAAGAVGLVAGLRR